jgi:hypothetical protein
LPLDRALTAKLLGFSAPHHNVFHASNARGKDEAVILSACGQIMLSLSRLAEDLILFSMPEFGYFVLPPELCTGSSIMPQKYNPDVLELIRAKTAAVLGYGTAANTLLKGLPGGYNRDLQETGAVHGGRARDARTCDHAQMARSLSLRPSGSGRASARGCSPRPRAGTGGRGMPFGTLSVCPFTSGRAGGGGSGPGAGGEDAHGGTRG